MKLGQLEQQPDERRSYSINYSSYLEGDRVQRAEGSASPVGLVVEMVAVYDEGQRVKFWVRGGVPGVNYKVTLDVYTFEGEHLQDEVIAKIKEV